MGKKKTVKKKTIAQKTKEFVETHEFSKNAPDRIVPVRKIASEDVLVEIQVGIINVNARIDRLVAAIDKSKSVRGI